MNIDDLLLFTKVQNMRDILSVAILLYYVTMSFFFREGAFTNYIGNA